MQMNVPADQLAHRHHDRTISPRQTVARLRPHFRALGITRLGELTGLDHVGIPVAMAVRPNSHSLSLSLGKGADRDAALASAAMEAAETAIAERLPGDVRWACAEEVRHAGLTTIDLGHVARCHPHRFRSRDHVAWASGVELTSGDRVLVPWPLVGLDHRSLPKGFHDAFYVASDGLASGNSADEAIFHGLCELVERDALARLQCGGAARLDRSELRPTGLEDAHLPALLELIERAGLRLRMFAMGSDIEVPAYLALLEPRHHRHAGRGNPTTRCGGCGCHPVAGRAMVKAITEAAQARLALVAGARDDIGSDHYGFEAAIPGETVRGVAAEEIRQGPPKPSAEEDTSCAQRVCDLLERLKHAGVDEIVAVELDARPVGIHVVRMFAKDLQVPLQGDRVQITRRGLRWIQEAAA